jgi:hypothetical protein
VTDTGALAIAQLLRTNTSITQLHLGLNSITDKGVIALAEVTIAAAGCRCRRCGGTRHTPFARQPRRASGSRRCRPCLPASRRRPRAPQALQHNSTLVTLGLSNNEISGAGAAALTRCMEKHNRSVKVVEMLPGNDISAKEAKALGKAVKRHTKWAAGRLAAGAVQLAQCSRRSWRLPGRCSRCA